MGKSKSNPNWGLPNDGGWELGPGETTRFDVPRDLFASRIWARTNCKKWPDGRFGCDTGDCGGGTSVACEGRGGRPPASLAEFTLNGGGDQDYYDVSLVDGYNLKISIRPKSANSERPGEYWCKNVECQSDLNEICPEELKTYNGDGQVVGCQSACEKFRDDAYCCAGSFSTSQTCQPHTWPVNYAAIFKQACPSAYSYAYDDSTSTFFCSNTGYEIIFC